MVALEIDYDGDSGPCHELHEIADRYDLMHALIGHERTGTMTLFVDIEDAGNLERELNEAGFPVRKN